MPFSLPFWAPKRKWGTGAKPRIHCIKIKKNKAKKNKAKNQKQKTHHFPFENQKRSKKQVGYPKYAAQKAKINKHRTLSSKHD